MCIRTTTTQLPYTHKRITSFIQNTHNIISFIHIYIYTRLYTRTFILYVQTSGAGAKTRARARARGRWRRMKIYVDRNAPTVLFKWLHFRRLANVCKFKLGASAQGSTDHIYIYIYIVLCNTAARRRTAGVCTHNILYTYIRLFAYNSVVRAWNDYNMHTLRRT